MDYQILGKTGLEVSLVSLGSGGHSRIGLATGRTPDESVAVVRYALEQGINLIDSSDFAAASRVSIPFSAALVILIISKTTFVTSPGGRCLRLSGTS